MADADVPRRGEDGWLALAVSSCGGRSKRTELRLSHLGQPDLHLFFTRRRICALPFVVLLFSCLLPSNLIPLARYCITTTIPHGRCESLSALAHLFASVCASLLMPVSFSNHPVNRAHIPRRTSPTALLLRLPALFLEPPRSFQIKVAWFKLVAPESCALQTCEVGYHRPLHSRRPPAETLQQATSDP